MFLILFGLFVLLFGLFLLLLLLDNSELFLALLFGKLGFDQSVVLPDLVGNEFSHAPFFLLLLELIFLLKCLLFTAVNYDIFYPLVQKWPKVDHKVQDANAYQEVSHLVGGP